MSKGLLKVFIRAPLKFYQTNGEALKVKLKNRLGK